MIVLSFKFFTPHLPEVESGSNSPGRVGLGPKIGLFVDPHQQVLQQQFSVVRPAFDLLDDFFQCERVMDVGAAAVHDVL